MLIVLESLVRTFLYQSFAEYFTDDTSANVPQVTLLFWLSVSHLMCFMLRILE